MSHAPGRSLRRQTPKSAGTLPGKPLSAVDFLPKPHRPARAGGLKGKAVPDETAIRDPQAGNLPQFIPRPSTPAACKGKFLNTLARTAKQAGSRRRERRTKQGTSRRTDHVPLAPQTMCKRQHEHHKRSRLRAQLDHLASVRKPLRIDLASFVGDAGCVLGGREGLRARG